MFLCVIIFLIVVAPSFMSGVGIVLLILLAIVVAGISFFVWRVRKLQQQLRDSGEQWSGAQQQSQQSQSGSRSQRGRKAGNVDIKIVDPTKTKRVADDVGDYVDFEEVKEK